MLTRLGIWFRRQSVGRKLTTTAVTTSGATLIAACTVFAIYDYVNLHLRLDVSDYWRSHSTAGFAVFISADNLTNQQVWMPDWGGNTGDTLPVNRGRTIYFGVELASKRRSPR